MAMLKPQKATCFLSSCSPALAWAARYFIKRENRPPASAFASLSALFSIRNGSDYAATIIHSVVVEEMLHMTTAANVLNAVGGAPLIDSPTFRPIARRVAAKPLRVRPGQLPLSLQLTHTPL